MIAIKNMKMPKTCEDCCLEKHDTDYWGYTFNFRCPLIDDYDWTESIRDTGRLPKCPLVEVTSARHTDEQRKAVKWDD